MVAVELRKGSWARKTRRRTGGLSFWRAASSRSPLCASRSAKECPFREPTWTSRAADRYDSDEPLLGPEGIARLIVAKGAAGSATIVSVSSTAKRDSMRPTIGTAGIRYRQTSRVWAPAAVAIEAAHITITIPARVKNAGRRRRTAVTVQNMTAITKAADNALNRQAEIPGRSAKKPIRTGPPCRSSG